MRTEDSHRYGETVIIPARYVFVLMAAFIIAFSVVLFAKFIELRSFPVDEKSAVHAKTASSEHNDNTGPFIITGAEGSLLHGCVLVPILRQAYKNIGIDIQYKPLPATRSIRMANTVYDAEVCRYEKMLVPFEDLVIVPPVLTEIRACVFSKKELPAVQDWQGLSSYRLAIRRGVVLFEQKTQNITERMQCTDLQQAILMLMNERVDVVLAMKIDFYHALNEMKQHNIVPRDVIFYAQEFIQIPVHHIINKRHQGIIPDLSAELHKMVDAGLFYHAIDVIVKE